MNETRTVMEMLRADRAEIISEWLARFSGETGRSGEPAREDFEVLYDALVEALPSEDWMRQLDAIERLARSRAAAGYAPEETAQMAGTLRHVLLERFAGTGRTEDVIRVSRMLDRVLQILFEAYVVARDELIARQQEDLLEISTPTMQLWEGIVALPIVGTLDSRRAIAVMESLLNKISSTSSAIAIIDVTGVPVVDTLVAQHLLKTVAAARLTGARCILCGIRPQIAQTMVELGIDLGGITTAANLAAAFSKALDLRGEMVTPRDAGAT